MSDEPSPATTEIRLIHEAEGIVVVDKPAPMIVHPTGPGRTTTLFDHLGGLFAYEIANGGQISIINRLDRETSGVTVVATTAEMARALSIAMQRRAFSKSYLAVVLGHPASDFFSVDDPLRRKGEIAQSRIWVKQAPHGDGAEAKTDFELISRHLHPRAGEISLVRARPVTGRMHQIRVHLASAGHPILGDKIYGADETCYLDFIDTGWTADLAARLCLRRQALHCREMALDATVAEDLEIGLDRLSWSSDLPPDMGALLAESEPLDPDPRDL